MNRKLIVGGLCSLFMLAGQMVITHADGPKIIPGAPLRYALNACSTNPQQAVSCIESIKIISPDTKRVLAIGSPTGKSFPVGNQIAANEGIHGAVMSANNSIVQRDSCDADGAQAVLQVLVNGAWQDYASAEGRTKTPVCDVNGPGWGLPYVHVTLDSGSQIRWHIFDPHHAWDSYSNPETFIPGFAKGSQEEWKFEGVTFSTGSNLAIPALEMQPSGATWCWFAGQCDSHREELSINISPEAVPGVKPKIIHFVDFASDLQCGPKESPTTCNVQPTFDQTYEFQFVVRVPQAFIFGEASGRGTKSLTVTDGVAGDPISGVATKEMTVDFQNLKTSSITTSELIPNPYSQGPHAHYETDIPNVWVYGQDNSIVGFLGSCGKVGGLIVGSNAITADSPQWDPATQTIGFRIEAPHLQTNGDINQGYVELHISQAMATCLWNTSLADTVAASISATYSDGGTPTVISVVGRKVGNDFIIASSGFHYSSPNLAIKLSNVESASNPPAPTTSPLPSASAMPSSNQTPAPAKGAPISSQKTITCVKGKNLKKITGAKPQCPSGYQKK